MDTYEAFSECLMGFVISVLSSEDTNVDLMAYSDWNTYT